MDNPVPGPGEGLFKVRSVGLWLPDLMAVQGRYPLITLPPAIPGHSFSGTIDSTGPGSSFTPGMRVMARTMYKNQAGALAEYALAREFDTFPVPDALDDAQAAGFVVPYRSEEHTSELQSLMRISYAVFCLKKKRINRTKSNTHLYNQMTHLLK